MAPAALAFVYCTQDDVDAVLSVDGTVGRADDDATGALSATETGRITKCINWASDRINLFLLSQYAAADLAGSWLVNEWCAIMAAYKLSCRRGNPPAGSLATLYDEAIEELKAVKSGEYQLPGIGARDLFTPAWSNVRVDLSYALRKIRVEKPMSERSSQQGTYTQQKDVISDMIIEPN